MTETLRAFADGDLGATYALYRDAVHNGTAPLYTAAQAKAWAPDAEMPAWWRDKFATAAGWVAEDDAGLSGFVTLEPDGYLNLFFVRPDRRRQGTAARLYEAALSHARAHGLALTCHASLLARPFLERRGWRLGAREEVARGNETLVRFFMDLPATE